MTRNEENNLLIIVEKLRDDIIKAFCDDDYDTDYYVNVARDDLRELALTMQARNAFRPIP